jgi:hypothetical protein
MTFYVSIILDLQNFLCRRSWYIAAHVWKNYDFKIEVVPLIINFSTELTTVVKFEVKVQKWCGRSGICGLFNFQLWRITFIDNIFVSFGGILFQQVVGIPMGTNCAPLLADLFLYSYESEFLQKLVKDPLVTPVKDFCVRYRLIIYRVDTCKLMLTCVCMNMDSNKLK